MIDRLRMFILRFIKSNKEVPLIAALAAGLYPILYYYAANFGYVNSIEHVVFFIIACIAIPALSILLFRFIFSKINALNKYKTYVVPVLNIFWFAILTLVSTSGLNTLKIILVICGALVLGILLAKHIKKLIVFQLFMACVALFWISPKLYVAAFQSKAWMDQPDAIEDVTFKKRPNIYLIQPDGYANFSELKRGHYKIENAEFESYLKHNGFTFYDDYRSNYFSTISSNSSLFSMKHHYYSKLQIKSVESFKSRYIIAGNNPVIDIFKKNNYKTCLILESEYLIVNRPKLNYDFSNILYKDMPYLTRGFDIRRYVIDDVKMAIKSNKATDNFYFIEKILPGHIAQSRFNNQGKEQERILYKDQIKEANAWLTELVETIQKEDDNSLIVIMADHGGFVGMNSIYEAKIKQTDPDLTRSVFTSALAIKWPQGDAHESLEFKSSVNFFRTLFSYLAEDEIYLNHLEEDASYLAIKKEAPFGVYKAIDENNKVIFDKITD